MDKNFQKIADVIKGFEKEYSHLKAKQPYHINVLDEIHANENAHSKILVKLLKYRYNNRYTILESFLNYFSNQNYDFNFDQKIEKPTITPEKERIDALIRDNSYAIIIENKIHGAVDKENQIDRYINKVQKENRKVFVVYLTARGGSPSKSSFSEILKEKFQTKHRYLEISYLRDILPWLEDEVLPNIAFKDFFVVSSIEHYIDHLKGLFGLRKMDYFMNSELLEYLKTALNGEADFKEKIESIVKMSDCLRMLKYMHYIEFLHEEIKNKYSDIDSVYWDTDYPHNRTGIIMTLQDGSKFSVTIEFSSHFHKLVGMSIHRCGDKNPTINQTLQKIIPGFDKMKKTENWYCRIEVKTKEEAFDKFCKFMVLVKEKFKEEIRIV